MKLSEAIRLGSAIRPQGFYTLRSAGKSCALGAALDAHGVSADNNIPAVMQLFKEWAPLMGASVCPECGDEPISIITHLNDTHRWTRERIADWVEIRELELEMNAVPPSIESYTEEPEAVPVTSI